MQTILILSLNLNQRRFLKRRSSGCLEKIFIIDSLIFFAPVTLNAANKPDLEELGKAMKLDFQT